MALLDQREENVGGLEKKIDAASMGLVFDNLQRFQYQHPEKSAVREIASNGVDAHIERDIARLILSGKALVSDYYEEREGDIYRSSRFNAAYYDPQWLSDKKNVLIKYEQREREERDLISFTDFGVGLGGDRLLGYFNLGWSSKRLGKSALGKFGLGAKSPLSTGVPSFRMRTCYNGKEFLFDIYSNKIQPLIDKFNEDGTENPIEFSYSVQVGTITNEETGQEEPQFATKHVRYKKTEEVNGTTISFEVKKHKRSMYRDAITNQLLYFENIDFFIIHEDGYNEKVSVTSTIFYESDNFILSQNNQFTKPHLVLGQKGAQVNYGLIDFTELELEQRFGNVGIKVTSEEIDISPSRETVLWTDKTRMTILAKFETAQREAENVIQEQLETDDLLEWLERYRNIWATRKNYETDDKASIILRLSGIIDKDRMNPVFRPNPDIKYKQPAVLFAGINKYPEDVVFHLIGQKEEYKHNQFYNMIRQNPVRSWDDIDFDRIFFSKGKTSSKKDSYLFSQTGTAFLYIKLEERDDKYWNDLFELKRLGEYDTLYSAAFRKKREEVRLAQIETTEPGTLGLLGEEDPFDVFISPSSSSILIPGEEKAIILEQAIKLATEKVEQRKQSYEQVKYIIDLMMQSKYAKDYDTVEVPADWKVSYNLLTAEELAELDKKKQEEYEREQEESRRNATVDNAVASKRRKEIRALNNQVFIRYVNLYKGGHTNDAELSFSNYEAYLDTINNFDGVMVYGTREDEEALKLAAYLLSGQLGIKEASHKEEYGSMLNYRGDSFPTLYIDYPFFNANIRLVKVSRELSKRFRNYIPVSRFLLDQREIDGKQTIVSHKMIRDWNTARTISQLVHSIHFLRFFGEISPHHTELWKRLYTFVKKFGFDTEIRFIHFPSEYKKDFVATLDKLGEFQRLIHNNPQLSAEEISETAKSLMGTSVENALVLDIEMVNLAQELYEWAEPVRNVLNSIRYFTHNEELPSTSNKESFLEEVRAFMNAKSVTMIDLPVVQITAEVVEEEENNN